MPFDPSKDEKVFEKSAKVNKGELIVSVFSYSGGPKKVQISKKIEDKEGNLTFAKKLGRLTKDEVKTLSALLSEAYKSL